MVSGQVRGGCEKGARWQDMREGKLRRVAKERVKEQVGEAEMTVGERSGTSSMQAEGWGTESTVHRPDTATHAENGHFLCDRPVHHQQAHAWQCEICPDTTPAADGCCWHTCP